VKRLIATLALATVAIAAAACSSTNADSGTPPAPASPADPSAPAITAANMAFVQADVTVPAGTPFQLTFSNTDSAPHNVAIYTDESASQALFQGEIFSAGTKVYDVPALAAGTYFFRCDVHPDMRGTITAK
jgi:plastocyanin